MMEEDIKAEFEDEKNGKNIKKRWKKMVSILLIVLLSGGAGYGGGMAALYYGNPSEANSNLTIKVNDDISTAEVVAEKVIPSVVGISTTSQVSYQSIFGSQTGVVSGVGTGIIVDPKGYILTNSHVVEDGAADAINVELSNGEEIAGVVLWHDKNIDLAIVKIEADHLVAATLGNSDEVKVGSYALAIGNPLGMAFERSVTQGVVSGLNRSITVSVGQTQSTMDNLIQTDASINSGNSGGPLLNSKGEVIGINSAKAQSAEGLGFAIPINTAKSVIDAIKTNGEFHKVYIGIKGISVAEYLQTYSEKNLGTEEGVYIVQIYTNSPAAKAGLREGDIIVGIQNEKIDTMTQLITNLYRYKPGETVAVEVIHGGSKTKETIRMQLEKMPDGN